MARISVQAAKGKGRRLQQHVCQGLRDAFPVLDAEDIRSCPMGSQGSDCILSPAAKKVIPYEIECKARASGYTALYDALDQARTQSKLTPVNVVKQDRKEALVVMTLSDWLILIAKS